MCAGVLEQLMSWAFPLGLSLYLLLDKRGGTALTPAVGLTSATTYLLLLFGSSGFKHIVPEDAVGCSCGNQVVLGLQCNRQRKQSCSVACRGL